MSRTILVILLLNIISCFIFRRFIHRGRMEILNFCPQGARPKSCCLFLAGMMNQPGAAFSRLRTATADQMVYAEFSIFGWNAKESIKQLNEYNGFIEHVPLTVFSISVGDKVARGITECKRIYALNPCPSPEVLNFRFRILSPVLAIVLELMTFLLGWIAVLPIIPADDTNYSLALLADQLFEIGIRRSKRRNIHRSCIVLSSRDEFLDNEKVKAYFWINNRRIIEIDTHHGRTADPEASTLYNRAILRLMTESK